MKDIKMLLRIMAFLLAMILPYLSVGQGQPVFRIVSCKGDVTLDDRTVKPGTTVYSDSKILMVGKNSYAGVLTEGGYTFKFTRGKIPVKEIEGRIKRKKYGRFFVSGAAIADPAEIEVLTAPQTGTYPFIFGDSVFVQWKENYKVYGPPFKVLFQTLFSDAISDTVINAGNTGYPVRHLLDEHGDITFQVTRDSRLSEEYLIRKLGNEERSSAQFDLERVNESDPVQKLITEMAIYDIHALFYDQMFYLYKLQRLEKKLSRPIENKYYKRLTKRLADEKPAIEAFHLR